MLSTARLFLRPSRTSTFSTSPRSLLMQQTRAACTPLSAASKCVGCEGFTDPMQREDVERYLETLLPQWNADEERTRISRDFRFPHFKAAMDFLNRVADLAESENHHPDMAIRRFRHVTIDLWTHAVSGLTENDIVMAAKIDTIPVPQPSSKK